MYILKLIKSRLGSILGGSVSGWLVKRTFGDQIPFAGLIVDLSTAKVPLSSYASLYWGIYESAERRFVTKYLLRDIPVIELGASLGAISSIIARRLDADVKMISVEANPNLEQCVLANLKRNAPHLNYKLYSAAVGYGDKFIDFLVDDSHHLTSAARLDNESEDSSNTKSVKVPCICLAELLQSLNCSSYQLICDIEGMEWDILKHEKESLDSCKLIIIESHDVRTSCRARDLFPEIEKLGFDMIDCYGNVAVFRRV